VLAKIEGRMDGLAIPDDALMRYQWGSSFTPWGEPDSSFCYLPLFYAQTARQLGMFNMETLGRPVPWVEVPENIVDTENDKAFSRLEAALQAQYKFYVLTRTTANRYNVTFPTNAILANGSAGQSELKWMEHFYGEVYIYVLGVQLTQDKTGGSRALEDSRIEVIADKTPPGVQALATMWQGGFSDHIWRVNSPTTPQSLWPKWEAEITMDPIDGFCNAQAMQALLQFAMKQIPAVVAERSISSVGFHPAYAAEMVAGMREAMERGELEIREMNSQPANVTARLAESMHTDVAKLKTAVSRLDRRVAHMEN